MTCDMRPETLIDLFGGELAEDEAVMVEQHLAECAACRAEMNALAVTTRPFASEESWQPDAAMADRVLLRAKANGWGAKPQAFADVATRESTTRGREEAPTPAMLPLAEERPPRASRIVERSPLGMLFAWMVRPLPSYATFGVALGALVVGLWLGSGVVRFPGRSTPTELNMTARNKAPGRLSKTAGQTTGPASRPIAFVAVYTDAMGLRDPEFRDSL
jgi:anti-sigma factor RsiW